MNNKQLQLVSFEQAKRLKKAGFDWEVTEMYNYLNKELGVITSYIPINFNKEKNVSISGKDINCISAPTVALALKWFRDERGIDNAVRIGAIHYEYTPDKVIKKTYYHNMIKDRVLPYRHYSYESAESALLDELLTLIDKEK